MANYQLIQKPTPMLGAAYTVWYMLEDLREREPEAVARLIESRVALRPDTALLHHPTVVILDDGEGPALGVLGILNGVLGLVGDMKYRIAAEFSEDQLVRFFLAEFPVSNEDRMRAFEYGS